jgi:TRAP-type C4-dicarboxylate transport system permease small subunit
MPIRWVRLAVAAFFVLYLLVVTWPVGTIFARAEPFVLGLPFSFFWPALWIVLGGVALALLDRAEDRERAGRKPDREAGDPRGPTPGPDR